MSTTERSRPAWPGLFVTFEGMDGSGKSTQLRLLAQRLRAAGYAVTESAEPGGTPIGRQIRQLLLDNKNHALAPTAELLLYFACRAQNVDEWIRPALEAGGVVLSDRYSDSTRAYQGAARRLGGTVVEELNAIACRGVDPQVTILVDIDLATSYERQKLRPRASDRLESEAQEFYQSVRDEYAQIAAREPERVRVVDGHGDVQTVAARIWTVIEPLLPELPV